MPWIDAPQPIELPWWARAASALVAVAFFTIFVFVIGNCAAVRPPDGIDELRMRLDRLESEVALLQSTPRVAIDYDDDDHPDAVDIGTVPCPEFMSPGPDDRCMKSDCNWCISRADGGVECTLLACSSKKQMEKM
jgi:hypothetical protein